MPAEIHRSIRSLNHIKYWKGTEYRTFLLYVGIVVLKDFLTQELYEHFLVLVSAVSICYCDAYKKYLSIAKKLFDEFIESYIEIYGIDEIGSNMHNLNHIVDDVNRFGNLNNISTYEFENTLGQIKLLLRRCDKPLEQISRRITESFNIKKQNWLDQKDFKPSVQYAFEDLNRPNIECYKQIYFKKDVRLSSRKFGDKFFLTHENEIVELDHIIRYNNSFRIFGFSLKNKGPFFSQPFSSTYINIFLSDLEKQNSKYHNVESIKCKLICLSYKTNYVLIPMLHSLD